MSGYGFSVERLSRNLGSGVAGLGRPEIEFLHDTTLNPTP